MAKSFFKSSKVISIVYAEYDCGHTKQKFISFKNGLTVGVANNISSIPALLFNSFRSSFIRSVTETED